MDNALSLVGLGKLGLGLAACYADCGIDVLGIDIEESVVNAVNDGKSPLMEPGLDQLLAEYGGKTLRATMKHSEAIEHSDITVILVATPSNPDGSFSNRHVEAALQSLATALKESGKENHLFIISSTVMPGSIMGSFVPLIEKYSGRKLNDGFDICFDPDFVALGHVVKGFKKPDLVIVGESNPDAGARVAALHDRMCENEPSVSRMSIESAELAKVCLNAYVCMKISFANSVGNLCESIPGTNVDDITKAIGADKRISPHYFSAGLSFGGTCFPRDTKAYMTLGKKQGVQTEIIESVERVNKHQDSRLSEMVLREVVKGEHRAVGVVGLAFAPGTPVVTESPALKLIQELQKSDLRTVAHDPNAIPATKAVLGSSVEYVNSVENCFDQTSLVVVTLRDASFKEAIESVKPDKEVTVVDCWRILDTEKLDSNIRCIAPGRSSSESAEDSSAPMLLPV